MQLIPKFKEGEERKEEKSDCIIRTPDPHSCGKLRNKWNKKYPEK